MSIAEIVFLLLGALTVIASIGVVTVSNVVHAALCLILSLLGVAGFYILLSNEFLALVQVLVYAGAVATIILFGLMLTRGHEMPDVPSGAQWPVALLVSIVLAVAVLYGALDSNYPGDVSEVALVSINSIGGALFKDWLLPFEIASVVLLVALIGAIVVSREEEGEEA